LYASLHALSIDIQHGIRTLLVEEDLEGRSESPTTFINEKRFHFLTTPGGQNTLNP